MSCSKTYCPYPFIGVSLQADGITLPCGQYTHIGKFPKTQSIDDARNGYMKTMRETMLDGKHDPGCQCPAEEAAGIKSMRQGAIERYGVQPFGKIQVAEIFFDNVCNLKCRMCASPYSHLLYDDEKKVYGEAISGTKYVRNTKYKDLDTAELQEVKVYGGEPLINKEADEFFKKIITKGNIENLSIDMSTNGTSLPMTNVLNAFLQCKELKLNISIDGYKDLNEYIRSGSDWNIISKNLEFFDRLIDKRKGKTTILVHSAIGVYNANIISDLDSYVKKNFPRFVKSTQMIQYPVFLNIQNTPQEYKKIIEPYVDKETYNFMWQKQNNYFPHFINFHNRMDAIRKENLANINPLLYDYINNYKDTVDNSKDFFIEQIKILQGAK